ncbi:MAG: SPOR domain-containing protein [Prevotellaceae bacterium]|nr:SPOR domain-containing protein [Prevotellaceae bacterium]
MIQIDTHIENLLLSHDCVIVPGIGGFVTRYESPIISEDGNEIYPPYRSIGFNSQLKTNDGLLAQSYMMAYDTDFPKAQSLVEENTRFIRKQLYQTGEYVFGTLGKLQLAQNQSLIFTPTNEAGIFSKDLYGLTSCLVNTQSNETVVAKATEELDLTPQEAQETHETTSAIQPAIKYTRQPTAQQPTTDDTHYVIRINKKFVSYTTGLIAAMLLYFIFTIAPSSNPITTNLQEATIISGIQSLQSKPTQQPPTRQTPKNNVADCQDKDTTLVSQPTPAETYTIVVASAISEKGANSIIQDLKDNNLNEAQFISNGKMNRVIYASYSSQQEAYSALKTLRSQNDRFSSAWVMKR